MVYVIKSKSSQRYLGMNTNLSINHNPIYSNQNLRKKYSIGDHESQTELI